MQSFDIYFLGEMLPDADPAGVRHGVAQLFKVQENAVDKLFSGKPLRVKQDVDADTASRYRSAFRDIGALIQIVPRGDAPPLARPPNTKLVASSQPVSAAQPSATGIAAAGLAEPGAIIDHTPPRPAADIDTGSLKALPANTGSLEDCQVEKPHRPIPDISHLKIVDD